MTRLVACSLFSLSIAFRAAAAELPEMRIEPLAPGVWRHVSYLEVPGYGPFPSNGLVVALDEGSLIVDTACDVEQTAELLDWAAANVGPPRALVVTHAHDDRMGGLAEVARRGIESFGSAATARLGEEGGLGTLDHTFEERLDLARFGLDGEVVWPGPGHSPDNVVVWLETPATLFGGCLVKSATAGSLGNVADADVDLWDATVAKVAERFPRAEVVVPGHGAPGGLELLERTRSLVEAFRARAAAGSAAARR